MPSLRRHRCPGTAVQAVRAVLAALCALVVLLAGPLGAARADDGDASTEPADQPVRMLLVTSGLTWEDVSAESTPHLQCLAQHAGLAAMNTTSTSVVSTKRQGEESLHTGYRGLASRAPRSAGVPDPPTDELAALPGGETEIDATRSVPTQSIREGLDGDSLLIVDLGSARRGTAADSSDQLAALDDRAGQAIDAAGGCAAVSGTAEDGTEDAGAADLPRTLLLSVAATDPEDPDAAETSGSIASRSSGLQVAMDTGSPGRTLTSGSTHQNGIVVLTDVLPTVLDSHGVEASHLLPGQPFEATSSREAPEQLALDRSLAARLVDGATPLALGSWFVLGAIGLVILLIPPLRRRRGFSRLARSLVSIAPLCVPVGLMASLVPWWRAEHPALALTGTVWAGSAILSVLVLAGPWRRSRFGPPGVAFALVAGLILLESALGSPWQTGSPLGAQPISGARFYGLSNHLFGMVFASALAALLCLFAHLRSARARVIAAIVCGVVFAGMCVSPSMGADFGSMLVSIPTFGLLALLVAGIRLRPWHVVVLCAGGVAAVLGVSYLDWLRPPAARSHLGRFIDDILSGDLGTVLLRKLSQNLGMLVDYPGLAVIVVAALLGSIAILAPRHLHWRALAALDQEHPSALRVRIALVAGGWLGYLVNDTGPVLITAALGMTILAIGAVLPLAEETGDRTGDEPLPPDPRTAGSVRA